MATMLRGDMSSEAHLNAVRRHMRLCGVGKGADVYAAAIKPAFDELVAKSRAATLKREDRQNALDVVILLDGDLDDCVRTAFEKFNQLDRASKKKPILKTIFPDGKFSSITSVNRLKEPDVVEQLAMRIESLGSQHPLFSIAAELREKVEASRKAIAELFAAITRQKKAEAEEEIAQIALRRRYEINYLEARRELGRYAAERLFPTYTNHPRTEDQPEAPPAEPPAA